MSLRALGGLARPLDLVVIAAAAAAFLASAYFVYGGPQPSTLVISSAEGEWLYPLAEDRSVAVDGPLGVTVVNIEGGRARIADSPCSNKTCMAAQPIASSGEWTACLPNGVFIRVEGGGNDDGVDATAR